MNILVLTQFFSTTKGGGEYVFSIMSKSLANDGHRIVVITNEIENEAYPVHENIKIIKVLPKLQYQGGLPTGFTENLRYVINAIRKGYSIIKKEKINIIHSNNFSPALAGSILSSLTGIPHVTTIHDVFSLCGKDYWKKWGKQTNISKLNVLLAPFFEKMLLKLNHAAIHTVSDTTKKDLEKFGATKPIYVIPNSIELNSIKTENPTPLQFVYVGRLVFYKNLEVVIKAIKIVKESYSNIKLVIIGDGPYRKNLERLVSELNLENNVQFKGFVPENEKIIQISSSQALVFPSLCEGFGLVILEAFLQKIPVLVSDIPPLTEIVIHEKTGFVIPPYEEKEWAQCIIRILRDSEGAKNMGLFGRKVLEQNYTPEITRKGIIQMYNEIRKI